VASGRQEFPLLPLVGGPQQGLLAVQMLAPDRIELEIWPGSTASSLPFDSSALIYLR
jgi:hypothetical protein